MPTHHVPAYAERPDVEVLVDGTWCAGEVRMQTQLDDDSWVVQVQWRPPGTNSRRIDTFPADRVRPDEPTTEISGSAIGRHVRT